MSEREGADGFLARWSRRKREVAAAPPETASPAPADAVLDQPAPDLPPVESLDAGSDYSAFLQAGVPEELKRLGLRRAWVTDPAIAEYRSLADYDWDFNQPDYGRLAEAVDDVSEMVRSVFGADEDPVPPSDGSEEAGPQTSGTDTPAPPSEA